MNPDKKYLVDLIKELCTLPFETEWVEFKHNNVDPNEIGERISALSNSAAIQGRDSAYLVWGVEDTSHQIIGTSFVPSSSKVGNEELQNWLLRLLSPKIELTFHTFDVDDKSVVLLEIQATSTSPVSFKRQEFIRVGTYTKKLGEFPEKERVLWRVFDHAPFERGVAVKNLSDKEVLSRLDYTVYFDLLDLPLPDGRSAILEALESDTLISRCETGNWNITRLGALLFAKQLEGFPDLKRKAIRVIQYKGHDRIETFKEQVGGKGYASGFEELVRYIMALIPSNEVIRQSLRETVPMFPEIAVRELVANALIHQDFTVTGAGPMVEIFENRVEITNPGEPLVDTNRFLDFPPKSRNEALASLMRRFRICEERGSGIDKVVFQIEYFQQPAPIFECLGGSTRVTLFAHRPLNRMDKNDRLRACYLHACLKWVSKEYMTNASLRQRFGIDEKNKARVSRYLSEAVAEGAIKPFEKDAPPKSMKYMPFWARI